MEVVGLAGLPIRVFHRLLAKNGVAHSIGDPTTPSSDTKLPTTNFLIANSRYARPPNRSGSRVRRSGLWFGTSPRDVVAWSVTPDNRAYISDASYLIRIWRIEIYIGHS
jgi:hypothetical protein